MIKQKLGKRIAELRNQLNISQETLSEKIDINQKSLSKIETGQNFLSAETLEKLLPALGVTCAELFDFDHLAPSQNLVNDIYNYIDTIKNDENSLMILHKITQALAKK